MVTGTNLAACDNIQKNGTAIVPTAIVQTAKKDEGNSEMYSFCWITAQVCFL